jgi:hypothetical protein
MNYIRHLTAFFHKIAMDDRLNPTHVSLYMALFQTWNVNRFQNPISISRFEMMKLSKISANATYHKCIKDLEQFGYLEYIPSYHPVKGSLINLFSFDTPTEQVTGRNPVKKQSGTEQVHLYSNTNSINKENVNAHTLSKNELVIKSGTSSGVEKPTQEEVHAYFNLQKYPANEADKFFNHFSSNGWLVGGKSKMKDWQAAARNWMLNAEKFNPSKESKPAAKHLDILNEKNYAEPL